MPLRAIKQTSVALVLFAAAALCQTPAPQKIPAAEVEASIIRKVQPEYPEIARRAHIQGAVVLNVVIDASGQVAEVEPASGHPLLVKPAEAAVRQWVYRPIVVDGEPVAVETTVTVDFTLQERSAAKPRAAPPVSLPAPGIRPTDNAKTPEEIAKRNQEIQALNKKFLREASQKIDAGRPAEAVRILEAAVRFAPSYDLLWAKLGDACRLAGRYEESIEAYKAALTIQPAGHYSARYWNNLGHSYAKLGDLTDALSSFHRAAELDSVSAGLFYFNAGAALMNDNRPQEALAEFDKSLAADQNRPDTYYWKGVALASLATLGPNGKAVIAPGTTEALRRYLQIMPEGQYAKHAQDLIQALEPY